MLRIKESTLKLWEKELGELEEIRKAIQIELQSSSESFSAKMNDQIKSLLEIQSKEYQGLPSLIEKYTDSEKQIIDIVQSLH